jgi:hypothetical protein
LVRAQLLFLILCLIFVGIALTAVITMYGDNAASANKAAVTHDLYLLATRAQQVYRRPSALGGGEGSFEPLTPDVGFTLLRSKSTNANGTYQICEPGNPSHVVLRGTGSENGANGRPIVVQMTVFPDTTTVAFINE